MRGFMARGQQQRPEMVSSRGREVAGIILLGLSLFFGLSVFSFQVGSGTLMGPCGATVGLGLYALFGIGAYLFSAGLGLVAIRCLSGSALKLRSIETGAVIAAGLA